MNDATSIDRSRRASPPSQADPWWAAAVLPHERSAPPDWARWVERALAGAPSRADRLAGGAPGWETPMRPFADAAARRFGERIRALGGPAGPSGALDHDALCGAVAEAVSATLLSVSARTLAHEHREHQQHRQQGDGLAAFVRQVSTASGLTALFRRYPLLGRQIGVVCRQAVDSAAEIVARFVGDRGAIVGALLDGVDPGPLTAIEPTSADRHQDGRTVALLRFAHQDARVVHKPRAPESAVLYAALAGWLDERLPGGGPAGVPFLARSGYGWARFTAPAPCRTPAEASRFYYRQGALLALLHAANGTDVHAGNLVAHRDQPLLVDTETLLHPIALDPLLTGADPALAALRRSVHRTVLLPTLVRGDGGATDISGLGGHGEEGAAPQGPPPGAGPAPTRPGARPPGTAPGANRPVLDGVPLDPVDHLPEFRRGFADAYTAIQRDAESFLGVLARARDVPVRFVPRATRVYAELLRDATAPEYLRCADDRHRLFGELLDAPGVDGSARLVEHEQRDLWNGDVPVFFARPGSRAVWTGDGTLLPDLLPASALDAARAKVRSMSAADLRRQEWIIEASFATGTGPLVHRSAEGIAPPAGGPAPFDPQWALDAALGIARQLDELAHREGGRSNWLGLEPLEDGHWEILPTGAGLAHGYTGVALFLAHLGAVSGRPEFLDRAAGALAPLPALLGALAGLPGHLAAIGTGFAGLGGIAYGLSRLAALLDCADIRSWLPDAVELIAAADAAGPEPAETYAEGLAGAVAALRAVRREHGTPAAGELERGLAERLAAAPGRHGLGPGFATGADGVEWVLGTPGGTPLTALRAGGAGDGWCRGAAGVAAAGRLEQAGLAAWLDHLATSPTYRDLSLCHGELGILDALAVLAPADDRARAVLDLRRARIAGAVERGARLSGTPRAVPSPGLLHGLAGTGYGLLRLGFADAVPSALAMEPGAPGRCGPC